MERFTKRALAACSLLALMGTAAAAQTGGTASVAEKTYRVAGLTSPAEIIVDRWGVPHLYADNTYDVFFVQGFNAARDRLWQIDLWRKRGMGELARDFGPAYVEQDRIARQFLYRGDMYREWLAYGSDAKRIAQRYTDGVNAFVTLARQNADLLPLEFKLLGYQPSYWLPEDIVRIRSHGLTRNLDSEIERAAVACAADLETDLMRRTLEVDSETAEWQTKVPEGLDPCAIPPQVAQAYKLGTGGVTFTKEKLAGAQRAELEPGRVPEIEPTALGSNNWAIAPAKTTTGRAILANDPHRAHGAPSLRYITHLNAPGFSVIGAGEPSLPGISIGHNGRIAFGLTIFSIDQEDLYVYDLNPADRSQYSYQGRWEPMTTASDEIPVKGQPDRKVDLRYTRHGPVLHVDEATNKAYAVRAAWLEPGMAPYFGSIDYMRAENWDEFLAAMNRWGSPSENQVYADTDGNIGWKPGGLTPVRPNWDGLLPVPGDGRYEWAGYRDMDELPVEYNPQRNWVGSANQNNLPAGYPNAEKKIGFEWTDPSRFDRISEVLDADRKFGLEDSMALQADNTSIQGRRVTALLKGLQSSDGDVEEALRMLTSWNGVLTADTAAGALYEVWFMKHLRPAVVRATVPKDAVELVDKGGVRSGEPAAIIAVLEQPDQRLGDTPAEARDALLLETLKPAVSELKAKLGPNMQAWRWASLHHGYFEHPLAAVVGAEEKGRLDVGPFPKGGSGFTPNATTYRTSDFRITAGGSFKMVLDVGNWDASRAVNTPGQSGDPNSPHYRDLAPLWQQEQYFPLLYSRKEIEGAAAERIRLMPSN
ncbi:penicillin acylase family protein [Skermanella sp. TT6]|nr:penicillin acylase family protein [Skermanella sp. TT6]